MDQFYPKKPPDAVATEENAGKNKFPYESRGSTRLKCL